MYVKYLAGLIQNAKETVFAIGLPAVDGGVGGVDVPVRGVDGWLPFHQRGGGQVAEGTEVHVSRVAQSRSGQHYIFARFFSSLAILLLLF